MEPPLAHAGHWAIWVLYSLPVLVVVGAAVNAYLAQRRDEREQQPH